MTVSPKIRARILALIETGLRQQDVAFDFGLSPGQVAGIVFRARTAAGRVPKPRNLSAPRPPKLKAIKTPEPVAAVPSGVAGAPSTPSTVPAPAATIVRRETVQARTFPARACQWIDGEPSPAQILDAIMRLVR